MSVYQMFSNHWLGCTSSNVGMFLYCIGVLLIAEIVSLFKKIGSLLR